MSNHRVLVLGEVTHAEMRPVVNAALGVFADADVRVAPHASVISSEEDWSPDVAVVCQSRPDEFSAADVHALFARFPVTRWVCCFGVWCESDGRNRDAWPFGARVPARMARSRLERERDVLNGLCDPLPLTAGREEAFAFDYAAGNAGRKPGLTGAVKSADPALRRAFADRLPVIGATITDAESADVILWDADPWNEAAAARLRRLRAANPAAAIVALLGLELPGDERMVTAAGADVVLAKLTGERGLACAVQQAVQRR